jgi:hypothetical protein
MQMQKFVPAIISLGIMLALAGLVLLIQPYYTLAQEDHPCRITVTPPEGRFAIGNMNPGDTASKSFTVTKVGEAPAYLYLRQEWLQGNPLPGMPGDLYSQLVMVISYQGRQIYRGKMSALPNPVNVTLMTLGRPILVGESIRLDCSVHLPGPETGNEFQGSSVVTRLVFYTACFEDEEVPPEPPEIDPPELPPTNGVLPMLLLAAGVSVIFAGIVLRKKAEA